MKWPYIVALIVVALAVTIKVVRLFLSRRITFSDHEGSPMMFAAPNNKQLQAATEKARASLDEFIDELKNASADFRSSIKVKVEDGRHTEYMWLDDLTYDNEIFSGTINNDPQTVSNVSLGDPWQASRDDIYDWLYKKNEKLYGNFSFKAALEKLPIEKQIAALREYGDAEQQRKQFAQEHFTDMNPMLSALAASTTPEQMINLIEKSPMPDEKKQEMIQRLREKMKN